ncbi:Cof-type HAD-IIB family hydrolase [Klebsiella sp. BIGb0407]|uniref:Cof-type HAD-IIB family hydrolase n=1 Tax=Klebsiella sp. BIGb0407 TaxID=2940603 RepID=UPI0021687582|nr:Cof-type HAD-IIB family hydrolase [Klebsiella sp. BIGb0407]MCS3432497.1 Cof subfamily protein (haloacid dehalogenase superfamily) [Klebsiella sp. BIGb0407]
MYKVLALDLDGTVLTDEQIINPQVKQAIQEAAKHWHVIIVTGRHHTAAYPYYAELGLDTPIICCNGTYIYDYENDSIITHTAISKDNALLFIALAQQKNLDLVMYITDAMVYSEYQPVAYMKKMEEWAGRSNLSKPPKIYRIKSFSDTVKNTEFIWKFVVEGEITQLDSLLNDSWVQTTFNAEQSWSNRIDFSAKGNTKGSRLREYISGIGYLPEQVIAAGDNYNDISMLEYAGLGIAMHHADETVKSYANVICTTDNNQNGIAHLIYEKIKG